MSRRKGGKGIKCNIGGGHSRVHWFHLILSADYMLNITYGKMSEEPVSYFSTENFPFLIFIKKEQNLRRCPLYLSQSRDLSH